MARLGRNVALAALVVWAAGCASRPRYVPYRTVLPYDTVECDAEWQGAWPVVNARVNGQGPFRFIVDTGSGALFLSEEIAESLGVEEIEQVQTLDSSGNICWKPVVGVDALAIGVNQPTGDTSEVRFEHLSAVVTGLKNFPDIDGLIGLRVFGECTLTLDYPARRVRLGQRPPDATDWVELDPDEYSATVKVEIGGREEQFVLDSGSVDFIGVNRTLANRLEFAVPPRRYGMALATSGKPFWQSMGRLKGDFRLGAWRIRRAVVSVDEGPSTVGGNFLRFFSVTFDQENGRVLLDGKLPKDFEMPPIKDYGVTIIRKNGHWVVFHVLPDSPAQRAGFRRGDHVLAIDGDAIETWTKIEVRERFKAQDTHTLRVRRGEEELELAMEKGIVIP